MRTAFLLSVAAALALFASPARASFEGPEGIVYPDVANPTAVDATPIVTNDVTYEGPHTVVLKAAPVAAFSLLTDNDLDAALPSPLPAKTAPDRAAARTTKVACDCPCGHRG